MKQVRWVKLPKTVPDGVHDGEDEVEAVADVEGDQDVVEAVAHLFPGEHNYTEGVAKESKSCHHNHCH